MAVVLANRLRRRYPITKNRSQLSDHDSRIISKVPEI
jgi:hypothetical protein